MNRFFTPLIFLLLSVFFFSGCEGCQPTVFNEPPALKNAPAENLLDGWEFLTEVRTQTRQPNGIMISLNEKKRTTGIPGKSHIETLDSVVNPSIPELTLESQRQVALSSLFWEKEGVVLNLDHFRAVYTRTTGEFPLTPSQPLSEIGYLPMGEKREFAGKSCEMWKKDMLVENGSVHMEECWTRDKDTPFYEWRPDLLPEDGYTMPLYMKHVQLDTYQNVLKLREEITTDMQHKKVAESFLQPPAEYREISPEEFDAGLHPPPPEDLRPAEEELPENTP